MKKRLMSLLLVCSMILSLFTGLSVTALAAGTGPAAATGQREIMGQGAATGQEEVMGQEATTGSVRTVSARYRSGAAAVSCCICPTINS